MCVTIGGTPVFDVNLQRWNGSAWAPGVDVLVNNNTQVCYFTSPLALADNGAQYRFLINNPAGEVASNTATVTVQAPSGITTTMLASRTSTGATPNNRSLTDHFRGWHVGGIQERRHQPRPRIHPMVTAMSGICRQASPRGRPDAGWQRAGYYGVTEMNWRPAGAMWCSPRSPTS